jgi:acetyl/propionyl-CoA carboxylase alpha subunit
MFKKILIANRGEIAVRILRTCRDLGIETVALYEADDRGSLHVRLADQCLLVRSSAGYMDEELILQTAQETGAEAVHPGYGFLAEKVGFARRCQESGLAFIGPPANVLAELQAGFEMERGAAVLSGPPVFIIRVQLLADGQGNSIHLGERRVSFQHGNQRVIEETPAPGLSEETRQALWKRALELAQQYHFQGLGSVEFLLTAGGQFFFNGFKAYLQAGHPVVELVTGLDLVAEQLRIAAGEPLGLKQEQVQIKGWAMLCRINAVDPWHGFLPSPGCLQKMRLPGGPGVRVDTHVYSSYSITPHYSPILAKLVVHGKDRDECLSRMRRALREFSLSGVPTNLPLLQLILEDPEFSAGRYIDERASQRLDEGEPSSDEAVEKEANFRDLAIAAAILYVRRKERFQPVVPERLLTGWHLNSRRPGR